MKAANLTVTPPSGAIYAISDGFVALVWRCLDGFDRWQTRRLAIQRLYGVNGQTLADIGVNRSEVNAFKYGEASLRRRIDGKH